MKKILYYTLALLATFATFSCSDKDNAYDEATDRLMQPIFRTDRTVPQGSSDPYICQLEGKNTIKLYWSRVAGAMGYQIKWTTNQSLAGNEEMWNDPAYLEGDTILYGEDVDQLTLPHLKYDKTYRFAIRALSDRGEAHNSLWYGVGDLHHYAEMCYISTGNRYDTPKIVAFKSKVGKDRFTVHLDISYEYSKYFGLDSEGKPVSGTKEIYTDAQLEEFNAHFGTSMINGHKVWNVDYLVVEPEATSPHAMVLGTEGAKKIKIDKNAYDIYNQQTIEVTGLDSNTVYNFYVMDQTIADTLSVADASYNLDMSQRTKGDPGPPIVVGLAYQDTIHAVIDGMEQPLDLPVPAVALQPLLEDFMKNNKFSENQVYYLKGGETYFTTAGLSVYKGMTLATDPADVAQGKRARVLLYHPDVLRHQKPSPAFFMLGRNPGSDENPNITIEIDKFIVQDIDFSIPMADNCGDGGLTNSYVMNMYSGGMGAIVNHLEFKNCSFQNIIGGFYRVQANYGVRIKEFVVDGCDFYNGGYYSTSGRRYNWFHANPEANPKINIWENFQMRNCTIFDTPLGYMFNHNKQQSIEWADDLHYNITLENNTIINFNTCADMMMFNLQYVPGGSSFIVRNNLFVLTKDANDNSGERKMVMDGCDVRYINGSGKIYCDFRDNYSTSDNLTLQKTVGGVEIYEIWSKTSSAWSYDKKNTFGSFFDQDDDPEDYEVTWGPGGRDGLRVLDAGISATDLMIQPNPRIHAGVADHYNHICDGIDGTVTNIDAGVRDGYKSHMVNLYFKDFNNVIVNKGIGAKKWYNK